MNVIAEIKSHSARCTYLIFPTDPQFQARDHLLRPVLQGLRVDQLQRARLGGRQHHLRSRSGSFSFKILKSDAGTGVWWPELERSRVYILLQMGIISSFAYLRKYLLLWGALVTYTCDNSCTLKFSLACRTNSAAKCWNKYLKNFQCNVKKLFAVTCIWNRDLPTRVFLPGLHLPCKVLHPYLSLPPNW